MCLGVSRLMQLVGRYDLDHFPKTMMTLSLGMLFVELLSYSSFLKSLSSSKPNELIKVTTFESSCNFMLKCIELGIMTFNNAPLKEYC
ncbi:hypothetical protein Lal_00012201 [Lupinus albus]|nr:hypothetical protein Lal_00012201 [Lupinus albus]